MDGTAELGLALGDQQARLTLSATLAAGASETHLRARLSPVTPSVIARAAPSLAAAGGAGRAGRRRGRRSTSMPTWRCATARLSLHAGAGQVRIGGSNVPFLERRAGGVGHAGAVARADAAGESAAAMPMRPADACRGARHDAAPRRPGQRRMSRRPRPGRLRRPGAALAGGHRRRRAATGWWRTSRSASRATVMSISAWRRRADLSSRRADARERHAGRRRAAGALAAAGAADRQRPGAVAHRRSGHAGDHRHRRTAAPARPEGSQRRRPADPRRQDAHHRHHAAAPGRRDRRRDRRLAARRDGTAARAAARPCSIVIRST